MQDPRDDYDFYGVPEYATIKGVTRATVNNWIKRRKVNAFKTGKNYTIYEPRTQKDNTSVFDASESPARPRGVGAE